MRQKAPALIWSSPANSLGGVRNAPEVSTTWKWKKRDTISFTQQCPHLQRIYVYVRGNVGGPHIIRQKSLFFCSSCRARSRLDGHQNVCGRSTILKLWENRWNCKRLDVLYNEKTQTKTQTKQTTKTHHPEKKKASSVLSETKNYAFRTNRSLGALRTSSRRHRKIPQVDWCPTLPIVREISLHTSQPLKRWDTLVHPRLGRCRCARPELLL